MTNRLIRETSPYLLQHAENPVDWYPWGEEAFLAARARDCPIFLSIGYASCHWCHVMEKEAFSDPKAAMLLNASFVNVKVDRQERPEIDGFYMDCAQALTSSPGGWPLNILLTPDLKPFFAVTYLPIHSTGGMLGICEFVAQVIQIWKSEEREELLEEADCLIQYVEEMTPGPGEEMPSQKQISLGIEMFLELADPVYGGIQGEPKFPFSYPCLFLFAYARHFVESRCLFLAEMSLHKMHQGGIYDHIGGGFSRYTVDEKWHEPHFEKMLIDNALLALTYLEAWKCTKKPFYQQICIELLEYVLRELKDPLEKGFMAAEDADSEGKEGAYYLWSFEEVQKALTTAQFHVFCHAYHLEPEGEFEGKNILRLAEPLQEAQQRSGFDPESFAMTLESARNKLFSLRSLRTPPEKDRQMICSWNAAMIDVLIKASSAWGEKKYLEAAELSMYFLHRKLWKEGALFHAYIRGEAKCSACLDDYAHCIRAALTCFEEGRGKEWLIWAIDLAKVLEEHFKMEGGAFYFSREDPFLLVRRCEFYDGAEPSGNSIHAENLIRLYQITRNHSFLTQAQDIFKAMKEQLEAFSAGSFYALSALFRSLDDSAALIVIALDEHQSGREEILKALGEVYRPHSVVVWLEEGEEVFLPHLKEKRPVEGKTTLYLSLGYEGKWLPPICELSDILKEIRKL